MIGVNERDGLKIITLLPGARGCVMEPEIAEKITEQVNQFADESDSRAILLNSSGKNFCTGLDLKWIVRMHELSEEEGWLEFKRIADLYWCLITCPLPVIAKVHGKVFGGGLGLCLASDIVVADTNTGFCLPEGNWGLSPGIVTYLLGKKLPYSLNLWLSILGGNVSGSEAKALGIVHYLGETPALSRHLDELCAKFKNFDRAALKTTKSIAFKASGMNRDDLLEAARHSYSLMRRPECRERVLSAYPGFAYE